MEAADIQQIELARRLCIAPTTLHGYLSGRRKPPAWRARQIARELGRAMDDIDWPSPAEDERPAATGT